MHPENMIIVHNQEHIEAALSIAEELQLSVQLQNPVEALHYLGVPYIKEMIEQAVAKYPNAPYVFVCDAGEDPAQAQEAFQAGFNIVRFSGNDVMRGKLASIATHFQGALYEQEEEEELLDLCFVDDAKEACKRWCLTTMAAA